jgi:hypothetical protein
MGRSMETTYIKGGHSAALVSENVPSVVEFIVYGKRKDIQTLVTGRKG